MFPTRDRDAREGLAWRDRAPCRKIQNAISRRRPRRCREKRDSATGRGGVKTGRGRSAVGSGPSADDAFCLSRIRIVPCPPFGTRTRHTRFFWFFWFRTKANTLNSPLFFYSCRVAAAVRPISDFRFDRGAICQKQSTNNIIKIHTSDFERRLERLEKKATKRYYIIQLFEFVLILFVSNVRTNKLIVWTERLKNIFLSKWNHNI